MRFYAGCPLTEKSPREVCRILPSRIQLLVKRNTQHSEPSSALDKIFGNKMLAKFFHGPDPTHPTGLNALAENWRDLLIGSTL